MQHFINVLKMADVHGKMILKPLIYGLKMLEEFELGLEEVWESECSSDSDVDQVSLTNRSCHLATGSVSSHLHKEF